MCNSNFGDKLDMSAMNVGDHLLMCDGAEFAEVDLGTAKIQGGVEMNKSKFAGKLNMHRINVGGGLFLGDGADFAEVDLGTARIERGLDICNSKFAGKLNMNGIKVGGDLCMRNGAEFADEVNIVSSLIEFNLIISNCAFNSLDLAGTYIGGEFTLGSGIRWVMKDSVLTLRNTEVGALRDLVDAWPPNLELGGFKYSRLGGFDGNETYSMAYRDIGWLKQEWLEKQRTYSPQPYEQLADVVKKMGLLDQANEILFAKKEREQKQAWDLQQWRSWFWLAAQRYSIGYGCHIFWSLGWIVGFIAVGWLIALRTIQGKHEGRLWCFIYSLDLLLPIIQLDKRNYDIHLSGWAKHYFYVHKIFGYVLAAFIIAGISGLTKQ